MFRSQSVAFILLLFCSAYAWSLGFRLVHLPPYFAGHRVSTPIDLDVDPQQDPYAKTRTVILKHRGLTAIVEGKYSYTIAGRVVLSDIYYTDALAKIAPVDLSLVWGPLSHDLGGLNFSHFLRIGSYRWRGAPPYDIDLMRRHFSNNHLIPANPTVREALMSIDVGDMVVLHGMLANVTAGGLRVSSSTTRDDSGDGACEIVFVDDVRINDRLYR